MSHSQRKRPTRAFQPTAYMAFADGLIGEILIPMVGADPDLGRTLALKLTAAVLSET
ncbi:hypothetical protein BH10PSE1_BH10PSE1_22610 [soil metagenome]